MPELNAWNLVLLAAVSYVAVVTLARLMRQRRDAILTEISRQADEERRRQKAQKKTESKRKSPARDAQRGAA